MILKVLFAFLLGFVLGAFGAGFLVTSPAGNYLIAPVIAASYLPRLAAVGQSTGERPAGTYARDILGQLLIDLSWSSSRLEGNRYSRLETKKLIEAAHEAAGKTRQEDRQDAQDVWNANGTRVRFIS